MNKTVTINISGIIFHIDENAYEKLKNYLNTIRSYFKDSDGKDEIMTDIEARIAELFNTKITKSKQVVLMEDVDEMIGIMGNPEVFKTDEGEQTQDEKQKSSSYKYKYDNGKYKYEYEYEYNHKKNKRIFRDPDDKVLGGVCGGIANYFDVDPIWFRLAFAISFFYFGVGFLFYIILWVVIPEAKTTAEKLEMKGEKVNINNIEKNIREEMEALKKRFNDNINSEKGKEYGSKISHATGSVIDFIVAFLKIAGNVFLRFLGVMIVIIGAILVAAFFASVFGNSNFIINSHGFSNFHFTDVMAKFFNTTSQIHEAQLILFLVIGMPLIWLVYLGVRLLFHIRIKHRWLNGLFTFSWIIGIIMGLFLMNDVAKEFREKSSVHTISQNINQPKNGVFYLNLPVSTKTDEEDENIYFNGNWHINVNENKGINLYYPHLDIQKSLSDSFELLIIQSAQGKTVKEAQNTAENITYTFDENDSTLTFHPNFTVDKNDKWRGQRVKIILKVPEGKSVYLRKNLRPIIYNINNVTNTYDGDMVNHLWKMTADGLACQDCSSMPGFSTKKKHPHNTDNDDENMY